MPRPTRRARALRPPPPLRRRAPRPRSRARAAAACKADSGTLGGIGARRPRTPRGPGGRPRGSPRAAVEDRVRHAGEELLEALREALGAEADRLEDARPARRTRVRAPDRVVAVVAEELRGPLVVRPRDRAVAAAEVLAAGAAEEGGRE